MNPRVINVKALDDYALALEFANGEKGIFSMKPYLEYPVFQPLKDVALFKTAKSTMGFVCWNDEIDMSPDNLYLECQKTT